MANRYWTAALGIFFIGGIALFFLTTLWYLPAGNYDLTRPYVVYFPGSLSGIAVGTPVEYRGIKIGKVGDLYLHYDEKTKQVSIPVIIYFLRRYGRFQHFPEAKDLIRQGLQASIVRDSLISSSSHIALFFSKDKSYYSANDTSFIQIPVAAKTVESADLDQLMKSVQVSLTNLDQLMKSAKVSSTNFSKLLNTTNIFLTGPTVTHFNATLSEIKDAANSLRVLLNYLARHPESLVTGKGKG